MSQVAEEIVLDAFDAIATGTERYQTGVCAQKRSGKPRYLIDAEIQALETDEIRKSVGVELSDKIVRHR